MLHVEQIENSAHPDFFVYLLAEADAGLLDVVDERKFGKPELSQQVYINFFLTCINVRQQVSVADVVNNS
jgi:hypothetical protein